MILSRIKDYFSSNKIRQIVYVSFIFLIFVSIYHLAYAKRIIPGVRIGSLRVGGMTYLQARKALEENEKKLTEEVVFKTDGKEYRIKGSDISLVYDWDGSVSRAFEVGRTGNLFIDNKDNSREKKEKYNFIMNNMRMSICELG